MQSRPGEHTRALSTARHCVRTSPTFPANCVDCARGASDGSELAMMLQKPECAYDVQVGGNMKVL